MKLHKEAGLIISNVRIDSSKAYVLFVGMDEKFVGITEPLCGISYANYKKPIEVINILPNIPSASVGNYIVLNEKLYEHMIQNDKERFFLSTSQNDINKAVSNSAYVKKLLNLILESQDDLYINLYKNTPEMNLHTKDERIKLIAPKSDLVEYFDDKINQRKMAEELNIPIPKGYVVEGVDELIKTYQSKFNGDAFVTCSHGAGGSGTFKVKNLDDILSSNKVKYNDHFIITELLDLKSSPSTQVVIANEKEVVVDGVGDQLMEGVNYMGSIFPSKSGEEKIKQMKEIALKIGRYLGKRGYRGICGIDFMHDASDKIYFTEINPRKIGTTPEFIWANKIINPTLPSFAELEYLAVTGNSFGRKAIVCGASGIQFGLQVVKAKEGQRTNGYIPNGKSEGEIFYNGGLTVLDYPGPVTCLNKSKIARIVCVEKTIPDYDHRKSIENQLYRAKQKIKVA